MRPCRSERGVSGFTLIELLVTLGVLALLVAILVPALVGARAAGRNAVTMSNLQQLGATFEQYLQAYGEAYPYAPPGSSFVVSPPDDGEIDIVMPGYWDLEMYWTALMHDVAPWREHFRTWVGPGAEVRPGKPWRRTDGRAGVPSYRLSHTFFARPELWEPEPVDSETLWRPVYIRDVRYVSSKVLLWDRELTHLRASPNADRDLRAMLFADGHVAVRRLSEASDPPVIPFKPDTRPVQDTPGGARGRDY
jgi:prepilin-type N-terminal cleavage/methylation domain-containing protein